MLSEDASKEIKDMPSLNTAQRVVGYIRGELSKYNDKHLLSVADSQGMKDLDAGAKNPDNAVVDIEQQMEDMFSKLETYVAAFAKQAPPPPLALNKGLLRERAMEREIASRAPIQLSKGAGTV